MADPEAIKKILDELNQKKGNKYGAQTCYSEICQRGFDSKAERSRGEQLRMMEMAGEIYDLEYQPKYVLNEKPKAVYTADFRYHDRCSNELIVEDVKGVTTEAARLRIIWLKQLTGIEVKVIK